MKKLNSAKAPGAPKGKAKGAKSIPAKAPGMAKGKSKKLVMPSL